jgi:dienelactone hydrolase
MIPVERIRGPVLLLSGRDDRLWPATRMAEEVMTRLAAHRHPYPFAHHAYAAAGHLFRVPGWPTTVRQTPGLAFGGTTGGQAAADRDAWARVLAFLRENLGE